MNITSTFDSRSGRNDPANLGRYLAPFQQGITTEMSGCDASSSEFMLEKRPFTQGLARDLVSLIERHRKGARPNSDPTAETDLCHVHAADLPMFSTRAAPADAASASAQ